VDVLAWFLIAAGSAFAVGCLASLARGPDPRRSGRGAHARPAPPDPDARRSTTKDLRTSLLTIATGMVWLMTLHAGHRAAEAAVGIAVVAIAAWELGSWLRSRRAGAPTAAWREFPFVVMPSLPALAWIAGRWSYATWVIAGLGVMMIASELDKWFRSRIAGRPAGPATGPPGG